MLAAIEDVEVLSALQARLRDARRQTDTLFNLVRPEALYERPIPERHRLVFYLGHLEAFDWNLLRPRITTTKPFDPELDRLFAFGIDPVDGALPSDQPCDWPSAPQIREYRDRIRTTLDAALVDRAARDWEGNESPGVLLNVAIEHRLMHAETLAYILHQLPYDQKAREAQVSPPLPGPPRTARVAIPSGHVTLGMPRDAGTFGWDNEFEAVCVEVPGFSIDRYKVTNGDYLKFVAAGGYRDRSLWNSDAWQWKEARGIVHPLFWSNAGAGVWRYRGMFEEIPLPLDWPVYVSHAEAAAYARWAGQRLPTEAEWQRAAYGVHENRAADHSEKSERLFPWGAEEPKPAHGYFDMSRWDPSPVNAFPASDSAFGVGGLIANGWEWTSSEFAPLPGFRPFPFYEGYSANFFDGMHYVMKGGSPRTDRCMLRRSFRNWFQPHYQYVYAGFRCAGS